VTLAIVFEEARDAADGLAQVIFVRQEDQAEVIRVRPVEAAALHQQHLFFLQQFGDELLIVGDRINLGSRRGNMYSVALGLTQVTPGIA
jgi:hypothetical protein